MPSSRTVAGVNGNGTGSWTEYRRHVLSVLESLEKQQEKIDKRLASLEKLVAMACGAWVVAQVGLSIWLATR